MKIADIKDLIREKTWAFSDPALKLSNRTKDKLDLIRIYESMPGLRKLLPEAIVKEIEADNP